MKNRIKYLLFLITLASCNDPESIYSHKVIKKGVRRVAHDQRIPGMHRVDTVTTDAIWLIDDYVIYEDTLVYSNSDGSAVHIPPPFTVYEKDSAGKWVEIRRVP